MLGDLVEEDRVRFVLRNHGLGDLDKLRGARRLQMEGDAAAQKGLR
jgi:hypothetical protein